MPPPERQPDKPPLLPVGAGGDPAEGSADPVGPTTGAQYKCKSFNYNQEKHIPFPAPRSPFLAFFLIKVNGVDLVNGINSNRPQYVTYFDFEIVGDGYTECNFRIFDPMWDVVEGEVLDNNEVLRDYRRDREKYSEIGALSTVQFGYANGVFPNSNPERNQQPLIDLWSPVYPMFLYDYQPKFLGYGVEIDVKLMCFFGAAVGGVAENRAWTATPIATQDPANPGIFEEKCNQFGATPCSPKSAPLLETGTQFGTPVPNNMPFVQPGIDSATFLRRVVGPLAMDANSVNEKNVPQNGASAVLFTADDNVLHMHDGIPGSNHVREYFYARQQFGTVLSFRPQVNGIALANFAGATVYVNGFDPKTGEPIRVEIDAGEINKTASYNTGELEDSYKIWDGKKTTTLNNIVPTTQANLGTMVIEGANMLVRAKQFAATAELVVLGDPLIKPMRQVLVIVMTFRKKKDGRVIPRIHYTSGIWTVSKVRHIIQNGEFITNLELYRNDKITPEGLREISSIFNDAFVDSDKEDGAKNQPPAETGSGGQQEQAGLQNNYPTNDLLR